MKSKLTVNTILTILGIILVGTVGYFTLFNASPASLLRICPDEWFVNRMPGVIDAGTENIAKEYFIYKGERRELAEFDIKWVKSNCLVKPMEVF